MDDIFDVNTSFEQMSLRSSVLRGIEAAGYVHPTQIQVQLIGPIMQGRDVFGQARTGTGKTAAFGLPILHDADRDLPMQALVLAPTRELASQVVQEINELAQFTPIRAVSIIGGESIRDQMHQLRDGGHIIVGTPGRVMDMLQRNAIQFNNVRWVVLDEVDRMLDIGFRDDIRRILGRIKHEHQTIFVSATISDEIERLARQFTRQDVEKIAVSADTLTVSEVTQNFLPVKPWDKKRLLLHLLRNETPELALVFCRTKRTVSDVAAYLKDKGIDVREIHGDLAQGRRTRVMNRLRDARVDVVVASDLAARGLDVEHISHIINYDLPDDIEVYVHRVGRTARAGRPGTAWSFVEPHQGQLLTEIEKLINVHIQQLDYPDFKSSQRHARHVDQEAEIAPPPRSRLSAPPPPAADTADTPPDPSMFPSGVVPKSTPKRTLGSRLPTRRGRR